MTDPDDMLLLHGYLDDELDAAGIIRVERLLAESSECRAALARLEAVREALRNPELAQQAPVGLAETVAAIGAIDAPPTRSMARLPSWLAGAIGGALAASLAFVVVISRTATPDLTGALLESHTRSLLAQHLLDVRTSDRHTVKPWFAGRTDLSPPVPDLADLGFPLVGGRLDVVQGRVVPAIVYRRRLHTINLFVLPGDGAQPARSIRRDGYSLVEWSQGGLRFAAVSDVDLPDLVQFMHVYADRSPA